MQFSLFFFSADAADAQREGYRLVIEAAKFADRNGFEAVWTPERHFHQFGGLYPNPGIMTAALAMVTERVALRAGSVVAPLHHPLRIAEDWALLDNLSGGRVGVALASGWQPNDFVLAPRSYAERKAATEDALHVLRSVWAGRSQSATNGVGEPVDLTLHPRPVQAHLPLWLTSTGAEATFVRAGELGVNVLTHLLTQNVEQLRSRVALYREAYRRAGHPGHGQVTLMLHTFIDQDEQRVREIVHDPLCAYLRSSSELMAQMAASVGIDVPDNLRDGEIDELMELAFRRYYESSGLFGTPRSALETLHRVHDAGVDEVACLIDFGIAGPLVLDGLGALNELRQRWSEELEALKFSLPTLMRDNHVTLFQCTPTLMQMHSQDPAMLEALSSVRALMLGGEALPLALAHDLRDRLAGDIVNMYGPTETTVWSSTHHMAADDFARGAAIGKPIANTQFYVLDQDLELVPAGAVGELCIGGLGVSQGYWDDPQETARRFIPNPFGEGKLYRTGDLVRWRRDQALEFIGRADSQVKLRGFRVELAEIEAVIGSHPWVLSCAVAVKRQDDAPRLVAYVSRRQDGDARRDLADRHLQARRAHWDEHYAQAAAAQAEPPAEASWMARLAEAAPRHVLELGCGRGADALWLAARCTRYLATDLSAAAVAALQARVGASSALSVSVLDVTQPSQQWPRAFDMVLARAVVEELCSSEQLERMIAWCVEQIQDGGRLVLGGVCALDTQYARHAGSQLRQAASMTTSDAIHERVQSAVRDEPLLHVAPAFFHALGARLERVCDVAIEVVDGAERPHERGRYDVTFQVGPRASTAEAARVLRWGAEVRDAEELSVALRAARELPLKIEDVPCDTWDEDMATWELLLEPAGPATEWELNKALWERASQSLSTSALCALAQAEGVELEIHVGSSSRSVHLWHRRPPGYALNERTLETPVPACNDPLNVLARGALSGELRSRAEARLPDYMVPLAFIELDSLPLTPNGKIDRKRLPEVDLSTARRSSTYVAPRTPIEQTLVEIWRGVLGVERCGIYDDFFDLGGDSLAALKLITRARSELGISLPLRELFEDANIAALAQVIEGQLARKRDAGERRLESAAAPS